MSTLETAITDRAGAGRATVPAGRASAVVVDSRPATGVFPSPVVEIVIPVYNEEAALRGSVERLHAYLAGEFPFPWRITLADNASTDSTWAIATATAESLDRVQALRLNRKGRGVALRTAWTRSEADVVAYMDVDLSTGLDALLPLVAALVSGHSDVAIGSRLSPGARVARGPLREFISRAYNRLLRTLFASKVHDAQCGFKALRRDVAQRLLPLIDDDEWFFDTELLLLADHNGLRIHEVPVDWVDDPDSRVHVVSTAMGDLVGTVRMVRRFLSERGRTDLATIGRDQVDHDMGRRLVTFASVGAISTVASLVVFLALRSTLGTIVANLVALAATLGANSWAHARFTLGRRRVRWGPALGTFAASAAISTAALAAALALGAGPVAEVAVVLTSWLSASFVRLELLRRLGR